MFQLKDGGEITVKLNPQTNFKIGTNLSSKSYSQHYLPIYDMKRTFLYYRYCPIILTFFSISFCFM